jgi:hypothetical protein
VHSTRIRTNVTVLIEQYVEILEHKFHFLRTKWATAQHVIRIVSGSGSG